MKKFFWILFFISILASRPVFSIDTKSCLAAVETFFTSDNPRIVIRRKLFQKSSKLQVELGHVELYGKDGKLLIHGFVDGDTVVSISAKRILKKMFQLLDKINLDDLGRVLIIHTHPTTPGTISNIFSTADIESFGLFKAALELMNIRTKLDGEIVFFSWGRIKTEELFFDMDDYGYRRITDRKMTNLNNLRNEDFDNQSGPNLLEAYENKFGVKL